MTDVAAVVLIETEVETGVADLVETEVVDQLCTKPFVMPAIKIVKYHLNQAVTNQYFVVTASANKVVVVTDQDLVAAVEIEGLALKVALLLLTTPRKYSKLSKL